MVIPEMGEFPTDFSPTSPFSPHPFSLSLLSLIDLQNRRDTTLIKPKKIYSTSGDCCTYLVSTDNCSLRLSLYILFRGGNALCLLECARGSELSILHTCKYLVNIVGMNMPCLFSGRYW